MSFSKNRKLLLFGSSGQVGNELKQRLSGHFELVLPGRNDFDLSMLSKLSDFIKFHSPDIIVNAAAFTDVDRAESERSLAWTVNAEAPSVMAFEANELGIPMVHFSSDYVFDGEQNGLYTEEDEVNPINYYGETKKDSESLLLHRYEKVIILRTGWVYSKSYGNNFYRTMLKLFESREKVKVVNDQVGCPTSAEYIASKLQSLISNDRLWSNDFDQWGLYHLVENRCMSWFEFAEDIWFNEQDFCDFKLQELIAIESAEYNSAAARPKNSCMSSLKFSQSFSI